MKWIPRFFSSFFFFSDHEFFFLKSPFRTHAPLWYLEFHLGAFYLPEVGSLLLGPPSSPSVIFFFTITDIRFYDPLATSEATEWVSDLTFSDEETRRKGTMPPARVPQLCGSGKCRFCGAKQVPLAAPRAAYAKWPVTEAGGAREVCVTCKVCAGTVVRIWWQVDRKLRAFKWNTISTACRVSQRAYLKKKKKSKDQMSIWNCFFKATS